MLSFELNWFERLEFVSVHVIKEVCEECFVLLVLEIFFGFEKLHFRFSLFSLALAKLDAFNKCFRTEKGFFFVR